MTKVVKGEEIFFKDDIKIVEGEIKTNLALPPIDLFNEELQIFYRGHIFVPSREIKKDRIKVYTLEYGFEEKESPKKQEEIYFNGNSIAISKLKEAFIEKILKGVSTLEEKHPLKGGLNSQIASVLIELIEKEYSKISFSDELVAKGANLIKQLNDCSVFNSMKGYERIMVLEEKLYNLITLSDYASHFEKAIEPAFFKKLKGACETCKPEEIFQLINDNENKIHRKVIGELRDRIWHSNRSFKLNLDDAYWITEFKETTKDMISKYMHLLEKKVKIDAVMECAGK